jgi:hypothetical protein
MLKHVFWLALAIAVGVAVAKMFGGSFNLAGLFGGTTTGGTTPCWLAALAFGEDLDGPRVSKVRDFLLDYERTGTIARFLMKLYRKYGLALSAIVSRDSWLDKVNQECFSRILARAKAMGY